MGGAKKNGGRKGVGRVGVGKKKEREYTRLGVPPLSV